MRKALAAPSAVSYAHASRARHPRRSPMFRTLLTCLLGLNVVLPAASVGPRVVSQEEILEIVDEWLYTFDEDDDGFLSGSEVEGLLKQLRQGSSVTGDAAAALTPQLLMSQVRLAA